uniref:Uncharacterized protein n=1 Tax=Anthurium amnicola TaxID=1678845 RepID=A0A1D1YWB4_9ARAE
MHCYQFPWVVQNEGRNNIFPQNLAWLLVLDCVGCLGISLDVRCLDSVWFTLPDRGLLRKLYVYWRTGSKPHCPKHISWWVAMNVLNRHLFQVQYHATSHFSS